MKRSGSVLAAAAFVVAFAGLAGCARTEPQPDAAAPAAAPAPAPEAPAQPIALDIKDAGGAALSGDPVRGGRVFVQCKTCHAVEAGVNKIGPSLHGVIGRAAGKVEGFRYSDANKGSNLVWTEQQLFTYLENPRAAMPGTTMSFVGIRDVQQRADVIAYLKQNAQ